MKSEKEGREMEGRERRKSGKEWKKSEKEGRERRKS